MLVTAKYDMETGYDVCNNELTFAKINTRPRAAVRTCFCTEILCAPPPRGEIVTHIAKWVKNISTVYIFFAHFYDFRKLFPTVYFYMLNAS